MGGPPPKRSKASREPPQRIPIEKAFRTPGPQFWIDEERLRKRYGVHAKDQDWRQCRDIALDLLGRNLAPPEKSEALFALGFAQEKLGDLDQALQSYDDALKVWPNHKASSRAEWRRGSQQRPGQQ